jgi:hypothetical protein
LLCGAYTATEIPTALIRAIGWPDRIVRKLAMYDRTQMLWYLHALAYDAGATRRLEPADGFHMCEGGALRAMRRAKALGMITVLQRGTTHPAHVDRVMRDEYARWGVPRREPRGSRGGGSRRSKPPISSSAKRRQGDLRSPGLRPPRADDAERRIGCP